MKTLMIDYQAFSIKDFGQILVDQTYFYGDYYPKPYNEEFIPKNKTSCLKQIEEEESKDQKP